MVKDNIEIPSEGSEAPEEIFQLMQHFSYGACDFDENMFERTRQSLLNTLDYWYRHTAKKAGVPTCDLYPDEHQE